MVTAFEMPQAEWQELKVARMTYPVLTVEDQGSWLGVERVKVKHRMLQGYFTFRLITNRHGPSLDEHIERGRSHVLASMVMDVTITPGVREEQIIQLFMVDLRRARMRLNLAKKKCNSKGEEYWEFDPLTPGVDLFAERLRTM